MAFLVDEFHALPSQIDGEDAGVIARLRQARTIYNTLQKANNQPDQLTPSEDSIIARVVKIRRDA